jgi:hypothetical protein
MAASVLPERQTLAGILTHGQYAQLIFRNKANASPFTNNLFDSPPSRHAACLMASVAMAQTGSSVDVIQTKLLMRGAAAVRRSRKD